jgi:tetratricopeptide (TPR) repeat protein
LLEGMGKVDFPITTRSKEAQAFFNQGVAQLYAFWAPEAERSFRQAAQLDPEAAMAYWGIAMAAPGNFAPAFQLVLAPDRKLPISVPPKSAESRARAAIVEASRLTEAITPRERLYIEAVAALHNPFLADPDAAYVAVMRRLIAAHPDDLNGKSILALALDNGYDPGTKSAKAGTLESIELLRGVLANDPDHIGANHFLVHALEGGKNLPDALPMAVHYAALVPNIPHALHMPGHVYAQIGMFDDAVRALLAAEAKEREYISADARYSKAHYIHNELFLLRVLQSQGRYAEVTSRILSLMKEQAGPSEPPDLPYRAGWFALMQTLVRFEKWDKILDGKTLPSLDQPFESIWYHWAHGLAYASTSNLVVARESLRSMEQSLRSLERLVSAIPPEYNIAQSELEAYIEVMAGETHKGLDGLVGSCKIIGRFGQRD